MRLVLEGDTVKFEPDFKDFEVFTFFPIPALFKAALHVQHNDNCTRNRSNANIYASTVQEKEIIPFSCACTYV